VRETKAGTGIARGDCGPGDGRVTSRSRRAAISRPGRRRG